MSEKNKDVHSSGKLIIGILFLMLFTLLMQLTQDKTHTY